ncbi:hypothetical protein BC829DRAFT_485778, partial [Chytridium lagenaria]
MLKAHTFGRPKVSTPGKPKTGPSSTATKSKKSPSSSHPHDKDKKTPVRVVRRPQKEFDTTVHDLKALRLTPKEDRLRKAAREISTRFHQTWSDRQNFSPPSTVSPSQWRSRNNINNDHVYSAKARTPTPSSGKKHVSSKAAKMLMDLGMDLDPEVLDLLSGPIPGANDGGRDDAPLTWEDVKEALDAINGPYRATLTLDDEESEDDVFRQDVWAEEPVVGRKPAINTRSPGQVVDFDAELRGWSQKRGGVPPSERSFVASQRPASAQQVKTPKKATVTPIAPKRGRVTTVPGSKVGSVRPPPQSLKEAATPLQNASPCLCASLLAHSELHHEATRLLDDLSKWNRSMTGRLSLIELHSIPGLNDAPLDADRLQDEDPTTLPVLILSEARAVLEATSTEMGRLDAVATSTRADLETTRARLHASERRVEALDRKLVESEERFREVIEIVWNLQSTVDVLCGITNNEENRGGEVDNKKDTSAAKDPFAQRDIRNRVDLKPLTPKNI